MNTVYTSYILMVRALREAARQPGVEAPNIFIPLFFFFVIVGAMGSISGTAFGVDNFVAFIMPVAMLQAAAGTASSAGLGMVTDIERGYFDKLMLSPAPRLSLVLGRMAGDGVRVVLLTTLILLIGLVRGSGMETGVLGALTVITLGGAFGLAYSGIGLSIALRTGSPQAAQLGFLIFFPLLFLSPAFAPKEIFADWLEFLATLNPVTYILEGIRSLVLDGWDWAALWKEAVSIGAFGAFTLSLTLLALRGRTA